MRSEEAFPHAKRVNWTVPKDSQKIFRAALRAGFVFKAGRGHAKLYAPDGTFVVLSSSASCSDSAKILNAQINKAAKRCGIDLEKA